MKAFSKTPPSNCMRRPSPRARDFVPGPTISTTCSKFSKRRGSTDSIHHLRSEVTGKREGQAEEPRELRAESARSEQPDGHICSRSRNRSNNLPWRGRRQKAKQLGHLVRKFETGTIRIAPQRTNRLPVRS